MRGVASTVLAALAALAVVAAPAFARRGSEGGGGDRREVRVAGVCVKSASSRLRLRAHDGRIETEFEVHGRRGIWNVTIVHERELVWHGRRRSSGSFGVAYRVPDYSGGDTVTARATGPRGGVCSATATLPG